MILVIVAVTVLQAIDRSEMMLGTVLEKAAFWKAHHQTPLSERQRKVINRLLDGLRSFHALPTQGPE